MRIEVLWSSVLSGIFLTACSTQSPNGPAGGAREFPVPFIAPEARCEPGPIPPESQISPDRIELGTGDSARLELHVTRNGYCDPIEIVAVDNLPLGVRAETCAATWPATIATVNLIVDGELADDIRTVRIHTWVGYDLAFDITLRTRATEPAWDDALIGIPGSRTSIDHVRLHESRILVAAEHVAVGGVIAVLRCIDVGVGPCPDFGTLGSVRLGEHPHPPFSDLQMERAPDGSVVVAVNMGHDAPTSETRLVRVTSWGEVILFEDESIVTGAQRTADLAVDEMGRILLLLSSDGDEISFSLHRFAGDGSRDTSFGADGSVRLPGGDGGWMVRTTPDGRIVLGAGHSLLWLEEDGTPAGPPVPILDPETGAGWGSVVWPFHVLRDGSFVYGIASEWESGEDEGSVMRLRPDGSLARKWDLGLGVQPRAFAVDGDMPIVIAQINDSGVLRVIRLEDDPVTIAERSIGAHVAYWTTRASNDGPLVITGTRDFRLTPPLVPWWEGFIWRVE